MFIEHRRFDRRATVRKLTEVDVVLAESKRLIAEIDVLLEYSHELTSKRTLLHKS